MPILQGRLSRKKLSQKNAENFAGKIKDLIFVVPKRKRGLRPEG
jgi:hypothetical protein